MEESPHEWILKRRHEDLSLTVRASWSLYIQFYTVFLTVSVVGLGWVLTRPADAPIVPRARHVIAVVFVIQTLLTAITSGAMALYTMRVAQDQEYIEKLLVQSHVDARPACGPAVPASLARFAGWFNCAAMLAMAALWLYVGFMGYPRRVMIAPEREQFLQRLALFSDRLARWADRGAHHRPPLLIVSAQS